MSTLFSRSTEYAIQAMLYLATKPPGERTLIKEIAPKLEIPIHFLAKILQTLSRKGLLISIKGPNGGFALGRPANEITLLQIVEIFDEPGFLDNCVIGLPKCSSDHPCPLHPTWADLKERIKNMLADESIEHLMKNSGDERGISKITV